MIFFLRKFILNKMIALNCLYMNVNLPRIEFKVFAILASVHADVSFPLPQPAHCMVWDAQLPQHPRIRIHISVIRGPPFPESISHFLSMCQRPPSFNVSVITSSVISSKIPIPQTPSVPPYVLICPYHT